MQLFASPSLRPPDDHIERNFSAASRVIRSDNVYQCGFAIRELAEVLRSTPPRSFRRRPFYRVRTFRGSTALKPSAPDQKIHNQDNQQDTPYADPPAVAVARIAIAATA